MTTSDIQALLTEAQDSRLHEILTNPLATMFDPYANNRPYLGNILFPIQRKLQIPHIVEDVQFQKLAARGADKYQPGDIMRAGRIQSYKIAPTSFKLKRPLEGVFLDALIGMGFFKPGGGANLATVERIINWVDKFVMGGLRDRMEAMIWQAIVFGEVELAGNGGAIGTVEYPNLPGQRESVSGQWSDPTYDPYEADIMPVKYWFDDNDRTMTRMVMSSKTFRLLARNPHIRKRTSTHFALTQDSAAFEATTGQATLKSVNAMLQADELPPVQLYNYKYTIEGAEKPERLSFIPDDTVVFFCETQVNNELEFDFKSTDDPAPNDVNSILTPDRLGVFYLGTNAGRTDPGLTILLNDHINQDPPAILTDGLGFGVPAIEDFRGFAVRSGIS